MNKIKEVYYKVVIGVSNILYYLPLIWEDRSWDYTYNYKFLRVKLEKQRRDILKYSYHVNKHNDAHELFVCIELLKRLEKDEYYRQYVSKSLVLKNHRYNYMKLKLGEKRYYQDIDLLATYLKKYGSGWWY